MDYFILIQKSVANNMLWKFPYVVFDGLAHIVKHLGAVQRDVKVYR